MFKKGRGNFMPGFDQGPLGVRSGIPPKLAYGPTGKKPKIPLNVDLGIEVEVVKITEGVIDKVSVLLCRQANVTAGIYLNLTVKYNFTYLRIIIGYYMLTCRHSQFLEADTSL